MGEIKTTVAFKKPVIECVGELRGLLAPPRRAQPTQVTAPSLLKKP